MGHRHGKGRRLKKALVKRSDRMLQIMEACDRIFSFENMPCIVMKTDTENTKGDGEDKKRKGEELVKKTIGQVGQGETEAEAGALDHNEATAGTEPEQGSGRKKHRHGKGRKLKKALAKTPGVEDMRSASTACAGGDQVDGKVDDSNLTNISTASSSAPACAIMANTGKLVDSKMESPKTMVIDVEKQMADLKLYAGLKQENIPATEDVVKAAVAKLNRLIHHRGVKSGTDNRLELINEGQGSDVGGSGDQKCDAESENSEKPSSRKKHRHGKGRKLKKTSTRALDVLENNEDLQPAVGDVEPKPIKVVKDKPIEVVKDKPIEVVKDKPIEVVIDEPIEVVEEPKPATDSIKYKNVETQTEQNNCENPPETTAVDQFATPEATAPKKKRNRKKNKNQQNTHQNELDNLPEDEKVNCDRSPSEESQIITSAPPTPVDSKKLTSAVEETFDKFIRGVKASSSSCSFDINKIKNARAENANAAEEENEIPPAPAPERPRRFMKTSLSSFFQDDPQQAQANASTEADESPAIGQPSRYGFGATDIRHRK